MGKKLTYEEFLDNVYKKNEHVRNGDVEIRGEFINTSHRIECYCNKHNILWSPIAASLYKGIGCKGCAKEGISEKNSKTHEEFVEELALLNDGIKVLTQYMGMYEDITVELKCGHIWTTKAVYVYHKYFECPYCTSNAILIGFNDLWTTSPETAVLLTNPEDGYLVTKGSGQKKNFTCPLCMKEQPKFVKNVVNRGLQCSFCGDSVSYPNKFGRAFLDQVIGNDYIPEYNVDWCRPYRYDNYFRYNDQDYFLELDGGYHYNETTISTISLEDRQEIDRIKDDLASKHNICVIRIDCRESNCQYIKNNILNSKLNQIFDLSNVNWEQCDIRAQKNLVKETCDLYMSGIQDINELSFMIKVSTNVVKKYLKRGAKFEWCDYSSKKKKGKKEKKRTNKPVIVTHINNGEQYDFISIAACVRELPVICGKKIFSTYVHDALKTGKPYKDFYFKFAE